MFGAMPGSFHDPDLARGLARVAAVGARPGRVERWLARRCPRDAGDHRHHIPTVVICLHGVVRVEGGPHGHADLHPGDALVIPPAVGHRHAPLRGRAQYLDLGSMVGTGDFELRGDGARVWGRTPLHPYSGWYERLARAGTADERAELLSRLCRRLAEERLATMIYPHPALERMANALWPLAPGLTTARILAASGLRASQAHALFRSFFAAPPKQVVIALRLGMAGHLLAEGATVGEAAERAGFRRRADLTRAWTARHGTPPSSA